MPRPTALARQQADAGRRQPAALRRFLQPDLKAGQGRGQQHEREPQSSFASSREIGVLARQQERRHRGRDQPGDDVDQEQPRPRPGLRDPAADDGPTVGASTATTPPIVVATA